MKNEYEYCSSLASPIEFKHTTEIEAIMQKQNKKK